MYAAVTFYTKEAGDGTHNHLGKGFVFFPQDFHYVAAVLVCNSSSSNAAHQADMFGKVMFMSSCLVGC